MRRKEAGWPNTSNNKMRGEEFYEKDARVLGPCMKSGSTRSRPVGRRAIGFEMGDN